MYNWYVITGAFSSGKSTLIKALAERGYRTEPEMARTVIDEGVDRGMSVEHVRADEAAFQELVLRRKLELEAALPKDELIFLDRGIPDSIAYMQLGGYDVASSRAASRPGVYRRIFLLDPLPFEADYARTEQAEEIGRIDRLIEEVYLELRYEVMRIPIEPVAARVERVLSLIKNT